MIFWIVATLMIVGTLAALALPLLRGKPAGMNEAAYDLEVYRDQLAELERDQARGVISADEMDAARNEIARRMLAADARLQKGTRTGGLMGGSTTMILVGVIAVMVSAGSVLLYMDVGDPGAPDMPLAQRRDLNKSVAGGQDMSSQLAELQKAAEANPEDVQGWVHLGGVYASLERYGEAAEAYRRAIEAGPVPLSVKGDYAEALLMAGEGTVTPEIRAIYEEILVANPTDPRALFYLARSDYQAGKTREALDKLAKLISSSPADAPWLPVVRDNLTRAANDLGLDVAEVMPEPLPAEQSGAPMLTPEQRAEMNSLSPEERQAKIREMVDRLDARLQDDPNDLEGWKRLIRARATLGEREAAQAALDRAMQVFVEAPEATRQFMELGRELQLTLPQHSTDTAKIAGMVEKLAARMKDTPDDLQGWVMLGRSYTVLGETEKARDAIDHAARLAPDDPDVLTLQARMIRAANGGKDNEETIAILRRVLEKAPDHAEALWFLGNAEAEAGNAAEARKLLERLLAQIPDGNPQKEVVQKRINEIDG